MRSEFIDPGALRAELTVEEAVRLPDGLGGLSETWREAATVFGRVEPMRADSRVGADRRFGEVTHRVTMRYRADLTGAMRLRRRGRVFEIVTLHDPDDTQRYLVALAREEAP